MASPSGRPLPAVLLHWLGIITGGPLVLLVVMLAIDDPPNPLIQPLSVQIALAALLATLVGLVLGWRWPLLGGTLALGGLAVFYVNELIPDGDLPGGAFPFFFIPTSLLLAAGVVTALKRRKAGAPSVR